MESDVPRSNTLANSFQVEPDGPRGPKFPPVLGFQDFNLRDEVLNGLTAQTMYRPHEIQRKVLPCLLNEPSKNLICISPPGSGKTIALCISILQKLDLSSEEAQNTPQALILVPSWDLAEYMRDLFETIGQFLRGLSVSILTTRSGDNLRPRNCCSPVIVGTPGQVLDEFKRRRISDRQIKILAVDAADDMIEYQGLGEQCLRMKYALRTVDQIQIALFSATSSDKINKYSERFAPKAHIIVQEPDKKPKLVQNFYVKVSAESKLDTFMDMMNVGALRGNLIIFVFKKASCAKILQRLREEQFPVGSMVAESRENDYKTWKEFMAGEIKILMVGLDYYRSLGFRSIGGVTNVVIYDMFPGNKLYCMSDEERSLKLVRCSGQALRSQGRCGNTLIFVDKEEDMPVLTSMESYLQTKIPCLEWDDLDQLELIWETLRVLSANRPELLEDGTIMIHKRQRQKLIADNILRGRDIEELGNCQTDRDQPSMPRIKYTSQDPQYPPRSDKSGQKFYNDGNAVSYVAEDPQRTPDTVVYSPNPQQTRQPKNRRKPARKQRKRSPNDNIGMDTRDPVKSHRGVTLEETDTINPISHKTINYLHETVDRRLQYKNKDERVRIAVLDTGIDLNHADFKLARTKWFNGKLESNPEKGETPQRDRIVKYKNFCGQEGNDGQEDGNIDDRDGHGTKVAGIILRLAPNADLYIARICPGMNRGDPPGADGVRLQGPQVPAVEKAIEWAIDERVHIINMSLGFKSPTHKDIQSLKAVLNKAKANHIVVFAAASNDGEHEKTAWPARDDEYAIGIHSATDLGKKSEIIARPIEKNYNFMVVGKGILSQRPSWDGGGFVTCTGASFATPVATAMGALILSFAWQKVCRRNRAKAEKKVLLDDLTTNRGMSKVLKEISEEVDGYRHISSSLLWKDFFESGDSDDLDKSLDESMDYGWGVIVRALLP